MRRPLSQKPAKNSKKSAASGKSTAGVALFAQSPYLSSLALRHAALPLPATEAALDALPGDTRRAAAAAQDDAALMSVLRLGKQKLALMLGHADLSGRIDDAAVMRHLSRFADAAVGACLSHLLRAAARARLLRLPDKKDPLHGCGVCVIALGKWGAFELNYSSDIDLMVVFDPARAPVVNRDDAQHFFNRLTRDMARLLESLTADGYVFRCDLRLRPDPGAMPLAISIGTAENYYGSLGQNWERAAMIKSRPVAGDAALADDFRRIMTAWIWRKNLDFAAIQDIHSIKRQINAKQARGRKSARDWHGFNVKLGHGGIREIEFFAQTQQLIFGGRDASLRLPDTCGALDALCAAGHVAAADRDALVSAYMFLRRIEHRLQMVDDRQTHSLPADDKDFAAFASFAGYENAAALKADLARHTGHVVRLYTALFGREESLSPQGSLVFTGVEDDPETLETLAAMGFETPDRVTAAIRGWHHGRYRAMRSERARQILTEITPPLLAALAATPAPDDAFTRFDRFLEQLPAGVPLFSMFARHPAQMALVADIIGTTPALADDIARHPQMLDGILTRDFLGRLPDLAYLAQQLEKLLAAARDYQDTLDITRRWAREKRFHAGIHILKRLSPPEKCGRYLSDIAEAALACLVPRVEEDFARTHGRFKTGELVLIGMGSFAARQMHTDSDLDLVGLYRVDAAESASDGKKPLSPGVYYIRLMQRVITAVTAPTAEYILYNIDSRLRPAGEDGPIAVRFDAYFDYMRQNAWTWEHMSLLRARPVYAAPATAKAWQKSARAILRQPRDAGKLLRDVRDMQAKTVRAFGQDDPWQVKYRKGGLMDILFAVQYLVLRHAAKKPALVHAHLRDAIAALKKEKILPARDAAALLAGCDAVMQVQEYLRLTTGASFDPARAGAAQCRAVAQRLMPDDKNPTIVKAEKSLARVFAASHAACLKILTPARKRRT